VVKTHLKYFDKMPLREDAIGVVYIVRNPLDVIVSALNYSELVREPLSDERRRAFVAEFVEHGGLNEWRQLGFGGWDEHVVSWHGKDMPLPRLTLRYEDLKASPFEPVSRLCRFLKITRSEKEIGDAIAASSFAKVRAMEEHEVALAKPGLFALENRQNTTGKRFMNKGEAGAYRDALSDDQVVQLRERFGRLMSKFGYDA
jgi:hypothetical protein